MTSSFYEQAHFGRFANDDARPPQPNVISLAIEAFGGRGHYRHTWKGHEFWEMGRWNGPFKLIPFIREANIRLHAQGKPQITGNPNWIIPGQEASHGHS
jgi:hypothetical protein